MNVLFLTSWYPSKENPTAAIFIHEHALSVKSTGANIRLVQIACEKEGVLFNKRVDKYEKDGIPVTSIKIQSKFSGVFYGLWPVLFFFLKKELSNKEFEDFKPDIIHTNVLYPSGFLGYLISKKNNAPFVLTSHWTKLHWVFNKPFFKGRGKKVLQKASCIFPVSQFLENQLKQYGGERIKTKVVPNVVNPELFYYQEKQEKEHIQLLCVTSFWNKKEMHKRPELLIDAIRLLDENEQKRIKLWFIGRGERQHTMQNDLLQNPVNAEIKFYGGQSKVFISDKMRAADYLVQATEKETFGVVIAEALCTGLPCIASDLTVLKELVNETNGLLLQNQAEEWARAFRKALKKELNFDKKAISEQMKKRFSYEAIGKLYMDEYIKIMGK